MSESANFHLLNEKIRRWVWAQDWRSLRNIQEKAIRPILNSDCDVLISAATAAGKTEAAFLPSCSLLLEQKPKGIGILYISPLKALINDQHRRLTRLGEILDIPITPWHGDVLPSIKQKQKKKPEGIILITPESLESLLFNDPSWCSLAFKDLSRIIIDEIHIFPGTERGAQLQSLIHRIECFIQKTVPRIALSATLGEIQQIKDYIRIDKKLQCTVIESSESRSDIKIQLRAYLNPIEETLPSALRKILGDLYSILRGKSHLIFANSRERTESVTATLRHYCEQNGVPNEFFSHHGNLSKEFRESLEERLQQDKLPTTAVCTMTLELGIDIGSIDTIAQLTAPYSVSSLRQRLGRSGRREEAAVLRLFIIENEIDSRSHLIDKLRMETVQCSAMINLLLQKWNEPSLHHQYHFSTLVQQTLSLIGQYGGIRADRLWDILCSSGPFWRIDQKLYSSFLKALGKERIISQTGDGLLIIGDKGENIIGHYSFYTAFKTSEEYRLECDGKELGTLPIDKPLVPKQFIIFAGSFWEVLTIDSSKKLISLKKASHGIPPAFGGEGCAIHDRVRREMFLIYQEKIIPPYIDKNAKEMLKEGIDVFHSFDLSNNKLIQYKGTTYLLPWLGDRTINTLTILFRIHGLNADSFGGMIDLSTEKGETENIMNSFDLVVEDILKTPKPTNAELANEIEDTVVEKHDYLLPKSILNLGYGERFFDIDAAWSFLKEIAER